MSPIQFLFELFYHVKQKYASAKGLKTCGESNSRTGDISIKIFSTKYSKKREGEMFYLPYIDI